MTCWENVRRKHATRLSFFSNSSKLHPHLYGRPISKFLGKKMAMWFEIEILFFFLRVRNRNWGRRLYLVQVKLKFSSSSSYDFQGGKIASTKEINKKNTARAAALAANQSNLSFPLALPFPPPLQSRRRRRRRHPPPPPSTAASQSTNPSTS